MQSLFTRWVIKGLIFFFPIAAIFAVLLVLRITNTDAYLAAQIDKHRLLETIPSPRVIVVGGSNVAFGLDSERLADLLNKPVINDGLHAELGMRVMLNDLAPLIQPGDVVVLAPEYEHFFNDYVEGDSLTLGTLLYFYPQVLKSFEVPQYIKLLDFPLQEIDHFIRVLRSNILNLVNFSISHSDPTPKTPIYSRSSFNRYGDMIGHLGQKNYTKIANDAYIGKNDSYNSTTIDVFNRFAKEAQAKGATVVLVFPFSRMSNCIATGIRFKQLDNYLRNRLDFPVLSHARDSCIADDLFYDTLYHLNIEGRQLKTLQLAELLINLP